MDWHWIWSDNFGDPHRTDKRAPGVSDREIMINPQAAKDAGINDGDIVILEPTRSCDDGDMVAVWLKAESETTLKKFFHEGSRIRLQPMNATTSPIYTTPANVEGQGRVLSSIRSAW